MYPLRNEDIDVNNALSMYLCIVLVVMYYRTNAETEMRSLSVALVSIANM